MRHAIVTDIHANMQAWEAVLQDFLSNDADSLVCLGDVVGYGPQPSEVLTGICQLTDNIILGNHDAAAAGLLNPNLFNPNAQISTIWTGNQLSDVQKQFLSKLPLIIDGGSFFCSHAEFERPQAFRYVDSLEKATTEFASTTHQINFIGHTHLPCVFCQDEKTGFVWEQALEDFTAVPGQRYIINGGSVGDPRDPEVAARYILFDDDSMKVYFRRLPIDLQAYRQAWFASGSPYKQYFISVLEYENASGMQSLPAATAASVGMHTPASGLMAKLNYGSGAGPAIKLRV